MEIKTFNNKKIKIRPLLPKDIKKAKKFQNFLNSLVEEGAPVHVDKKVSLKEEISWIKNNIKDIKKHRKVFLVAENRDIIVGIAHIDLYPGRQNHVGMLGISIRKGYRQIGLGSHLVKEIIKLAKAKLKPSPKIIRSSVFSINKPAIVFYKKLGFKKVAKIPKQVKFQDKLVDEVVMLLNVV